jgi:tRNA modification GTPase
MNDTIYALASGHGTAGVAVIRVSGPRANDVLSKIATKPLPKPRIASLRRLHDIDDAIVIWFPGPASFTGEDIVEFHIHGGTAVIDAVFSAISGIEECRMANPGEFTRRAFENKKLDLTSAEAVADLVAAETTEQRRQALAQYDGVLANLYDEWRTKLTELLANTEVMIDFSDEEIPDDLYLTNKHNILCIKNIISQYIDDKHIGERIRTGFRVAIIGEPNVGKSSLLNKIAGREAAIVSEIKGTTRDIIEVHIQLGGYAVIIADTAGLRETQEEVESEGVRRAQKLAENADLKLVMFDVTNFPKIGEISKKYLDDDAIAIFNKVDILKKPILFDLDFHSIFSVSALTGEGLDLLMSNLQEKIQKRLKNAEIPPLTRTRHREALEAVVGALGRAENAVLPELAAEDLRLATRALARITGRVDVEDVLDIIFMDFCIGK